MSVQGIGQASAQGSERHFNGLEIAALFVTATAAVWGTHRLLKGNSYQLLASAGALVPFVCVGGWIVTRSTAIPFSKETIDLELKSAGEDEFLVLDQQIKEAIGKISSPNAQKRQQEARLYLWAKGSEGGLISPQRLFQTFSDEEERATLLTQMDVHCCIDSLADLENEEHRGELLKSLMTPNRVKAAGKRMAELDPDELIESGRYWQGEAADMLFKVIFMPRSGNPESEGWTDPTYIRNSALNSMQKPTKLSFHSFLLHLKKVRRHKEYPAYLRTFGTDLAQLWCTRYIRIENFRVELQERHPHLPIPSDHWWKSISDSDRW